MALILETGGGVQTANAYATEAFVDGYLTERNRDTENGWSGLATTVKEAAIIAATQYIDDRWGGRFKGNKATYFDGIQSQALAVFSGQPANDENLILGDVTYVFKTTLSTLTADAEVLIGGTLPETLTNFIDAIANNKNATGSSDDVDTITFVARQDGVSGDDILFTTTTTAVLTGFINGQDYGSQGLEFPRTSLWDVDGIAVVGVPLKLKQATAEYAVRASTEQLFQDPTTDASGRAVTKEKIGPIETEYTDGGSADFIIKPYPAADALLKQYIKPAGIYR